jgi:hypothetical protein
VIVNTGSGQAERSSVAEHSWIFSPTRKVLDGEAIFWPLPLNVERTGIVVVENSSFVGSRFYGIGFAGDEATIAKFRSGIATAQ